MFCFCGNKSNIPHGSETKTAYPTTEVYVSFDILPVTYNHAEGTIHVCKGAKPSEAPGTLCFAITENRQKCMLMAHVFLYRGDPLS